MSCIFFGILFVIRISLLGTNIKSVIKLKIHNSGWANLKYIIPVERTIDKPYKYLDTVLYVPNLWLVNMYYWGFCLDEYILLRFLFKWLRSSSPGLDRIFFYVSKVRWNLLKFKNGSFSSNKPEGLNTNIKETVKTLCICMKALECPMCYLVWCDCNYLH